MTSTLLDQCTAGAFDGSIPFPEAVRRMTEAGVEWYSANLIFGITTYYAADLSHHPTPWPNWSTPPIADAFSAEGVKGAIRASQAREIRYPEFLQRIAEAGVVYYTVHLKGRRAIYFGRHGDSWIEPFPQS